MHSSSRRGGNELRTDWRQTAPITSCAKVLKAKTARCAALDIAALRLCRGRLSHAIYIAREARFDDVHIGGECRCSNPLVSRARCSVLHAASQNRDPGFFRADVPSEQPPASPVSQTSAIEQFGVPQSRNGKPSCSQELLRNPAMGLFTKDIKTMNDLFVHQLQDIYYADLAGRRQGQPARGELRNDFATLGVMRGLDPRIHLASRESFE
jgi:hypothetical protein